jgi:hypothetical protein
MAFGTPGVQLASTYRIAPTNNRLQKNMYGTGYLEIMDYNVVDALPNLGYGSATGNPNAEDDRYASKSIRSNA